MYVSSYVNSVMCTRARAHVAAVTCTYLLMRENEQIAAAAAAAVALVPSTNGAATIANMRPLI